jgi:hypothetical protein
MPTSEKNGRKVGVTRSSPSPKRHWGVLIAVVGALIVYSAGDAAVRTPVLIAAAVEKIALGLLLFRGSVKPTSIIKAAAVGDCLLAIPIAGRQLNERISAVDNGLGFGLGRPRRPRRHYSVPFHRHSFEPIVNQLG